MPQQIWICNFERTVDVHRNPSISAGFFRGLSDLINDPSILHAPGINPVFPGLEDLHRLENSTKWYCTTMEDTALSIEFCKGAVNYETWHF